MRTALGKATSPIAAAVQIFLRKGALVRSYGRVVLRVLNGRLWITRSGDPRDMFVSAGDHIELPNEGDALIEADFDSVVELASPCAPRASDEPPRFTITPTCWSAG